MPSSNTGTLTKISFKSEMSGVQSFNYENYKKLTLKHAKSYDYYFYVKIYNFLIIIFFSYI